MNEGFGGIRDLLILGRRDTYLKQFKGSGERLAGAKASNIILALVPRYLMELVTFGALISFVLVYTVLNDASAAETLTSISFLALAAMKLLPATQQGVSICVKYRTHLVAFEEIKLDLINSKQHVCIESGIERLDQVNDLEFKDKIELKNITFYYPGSDSASLDNLNLVIKKNSSVGIVGPSGSGKSTTIDMLLGLINPDEGAFFIDDVEINQHNLRGWQDQIGFVPQSIFLSDSSIEENIAFGVERSLVDTDKVQSALKLAHLDELVNKLDDGVHTNVGERGVQLSGGQRQRIGIARALYGDSQLLVFDEATSALDGVTENNIMNAIKEFQGKKTLVMIAHRLKTVKDCDVIYFIDNGTVVDQGSYDELLKRNKVFKNMTQHS